MLTDLEKLSANLSKMAANESNLHITARLSYHIVFLHQFARIAH